ncbi:glycosyltransferase [Vibrio sp. TRT 17S01]|uniref:glycosyltransferase n=1 Tax=Vibrio sp. TRT 17S01 TaxID=3418505 RepID=UPI003CF0F36E
MKYLIIDPLGNASGISSYTHFLGNVLSELDIDFEVVSNTKKLNPQKFREFIYEHVTTKYGFNDVIIEAPEAKASTLLLPKEYNVHIRLHCPLSIAQKYDSQVVNQVEYSNELRVINKSKLVSSPSYGLLEELKSEIDTDRVFVYKNPITLRPDLIKPVNTKKYDLVFMGRMQHLKGYDYIRKIVERLPKDFNVLVFGNNSHRVKLGKNYKCKVDIRQQIVSDEKFKLIADSKVLMQLSRFENCSMVILEAMSVGTPVVCWNVGGNAEIPHKGVVRPVTKGDISEIVDNIVSMARQEKFVRSDFIDALEGVNGDFKEGIVSVLSFFKQPSITPVYKGIDHSAENLSSVRRTDVVQLDERYKPKRVMGIAYSNEHVEELWAPIVDALGCEYRYVSRRPVGFHSVFKKQEPKFNQKYYCVFDWVKNPERLITQILSYKPNVILFHNGAHPVYKSVMERIKNLGIPVIYSELGWFPQYNHVYFDQDGVNGQSQLAKLSFSELVKEAEVESVNQRAKKLRGKYHLVATQLENDTNLIVNSNRFKSRDSFIKYVLGQIDENERVLLKLHPLDKAPLGFDIEEYKNVTVVTDNITDLLEKAKSVIAINSTVLLQALEYDCNIYYCGDSILDNKGIAEKFDHSELRDLLSDKLYCSQEKKSKLVSALKSIQINLDEIRTMDKEQVLAHRGIRAFFDMDRQDFSEIIDLEKKRREDQKSKPTSVAVVAQPATTVGATQNPAQPKKTVINDLVKTIPEHWRKKVPVNIRRIFVKRAS